MSSTEGTGDAPATRDKERTRAAILDAAERMFAAKGANVSLAEIAAEAGVTKSGLLHHFPSRGTLLSAVVGHVLDRVWVEVADLVEPDAGRPGAFCRAYVRASTGDSAYLREVFGAAGLFASLGLEAAQEYEEAFPDEIARWNTAFEADGLPLGRALAVRYAADGVLLALGTPYLTEAQRVVVRAELMARTEL